MHIIYQMYYTYIYSTSILICGVIKRTFDYFNAVYYACIKFLNAVYYACIKFLMWYTMHALSFNTEIQL